MLGTNLTPNSARYFAKKIARRVNPTPAVFVDRDGVINHNRADHVVRWQDFEFEEGAREALRLLKKTGHQVFVVTNQAVIGRGTATQAEIDYLHARMLKEVRASGGDITEVFCCPHRPEVNCICRKPRPGLLYQATARYKIELSKSWLIGDYITDVEAGLSAGCKPILVLTGRGKEAWDSWQQSGKETTPFLVKPNLLQAVEHLLKLDG